MLEWANGRRVAVLFAFEEETETSKFSIHRLAHYCLGLAELFDTERVVPVAVFLRKGERPASLTVGGDRYDFLTFRYLACALKQLNWQNWRDSDNIVARLNLPNMRYAPSERVALCSFMQAGVQVGTQGQEMPVVVGPLHGPLVVSGFAAGIAGEELLGLDAGIRLIARQALRDCDQRIKRRVVLNGLFAHNRLP